MTSPTLKHTRPVDAPKTEEDGTIVESIVHDVVDDEEARFIAFVDELAVLRASDHVHAARPTPNAP